MAELYDAAVGSVNGSNKSASVLPVDDTVGVPSTCWHRKPWGHY